MAMILIDRGSVAAVGKRITTDDFAISKRIDCSERIVMPGLVNTHSHLTGNFAKKPPRQCQDLKE